jgi:Xaa-Pro aminopeptidase
MIPKDHERLEQIQRRLRENHWDALLVFHNEHLLMTTGMFPGSTHVASIVTTDQRVVVLTPWWRERFVREESWADEVRSFDWCRGLNGVEPVSALCDLIRQCQSDLRLSRIGYDARLHHYGPGKIPSELFTYQEIKEALGTLFTKFEDAGEILEELKAIKTRQEVAKIRLSQEVAREGVRAFYHSARAGIRETDLAAEVNYAVLKMAGHKGIRYSYCDPPQITSGPERTAIADTMSNHATDRVLAQGNLVMLEFGVQADGYWSDITRNLVIGGPTKDQIRTYEAILKAQQAAIAAYVPNKSTGEELCQAAWEAMRQAGFGDAITHSLGHGLGFAYHETRPMLGPGNKQPIRPGHVTSLEPGLYFRTNGSFGGGVRVEDNVLWGDESGQAEILSNFYRGLDPAQWPTT